MAALSPGCRKLSTAIAALLTIATPAPAALYTPTYQDEVESILRQFETVQKAEHFETSAMSLARLTAAQYVYVGPCKGVVKGLPDGGDAGLLVPSLDLSSAQTRMIYQLIAIYVMTGFNAPSHYACEFALVEGWPPRP